ncbi:hypothetical protein ACS5PK_20350 [Roseateles sp. DB2]|uniref:hypothetical protein n=1 Tax=Roseateles sp. DB2 TaxID=3453717 RepID=UPI003EEBB9F5
MAEVSWRRRLRWLMMPLAVVSLGWTASLLADSWPALHHSLPQVQWTWLLWTLALNVLSGYLAFEAFRALFNKVQPSSYGRLQMAHLYFAGQLMKHLPGRVWGLAYQAAQGQRASLAQWVAVTSVYMVLSTAIALWVAGTVLSFYVAWIWGLAAFGAGVAAYLLGWQAAPLKALLSLARRASLPALTRLSDALQPFTNLDAHFKWQVLAWFLASWGLYLLAWAGYGMAWPGLQAIDGVWLCSLYTVAWFVGYASLVTPSGLGVRELTFVLLAQQFPADVVAGMAVLGRLVLLCVDVLLGAAFLPFGAPNDDKPC